MHIHHVFQDTPFSASSFTRALVHDSENFKIINFNFEPGQELPVHSHDIDGELSIVVLSGEGQFLSDGEPVPANTGDVLVCPIAVPHGIRAISRMSVIVTIAPPI